MRNFFGVVGMLSVICISQGISAAKWYVDCSVSASGDGTSWETALKKIQEGIDKATNGDTVIVAEGTYVENVKFKGKNVVLTGTDPADPAIVARTIIDGDHAGSVVTLKGTENDTCVLSGFTIRNGSADGAGVSGWSYSSDSLATIRNNTITGNSAGSFGGGLYGCDGTIQDNAIIGNSAMFGGGLYGCDGTIEGNTISGNEGGGLESCNGPVLNNTIAGNSVGFFGGGLYGCDGTIENNTITGNSAKYGAGGVYGCGGTIRNNTITGNSGGGLGGCDGTIEANMIAGNKGAGLSGCNGVVQNNTITGNSGGGLGGCDGTIQNNTISGNSAEYDGGGLSYCNATIQNNTITDNSAGTGGGGLYECNGAVQNNTISGNSAEYDGGGLEWCSGTIQNNTITANSAESAGGGLDGCNGTIQNNIITGNSAGQYGGGLINCFDTIQNNTITGNSAGYEGGGLWNCDGTIQNCVIWGNSAPTGPQLYYCSLPSFCCIQGWKRGGEGNITEDPQFVDPDGPDDNPDTWEDNNYRLRADSPCIDAGKNEDWMWSAVDLDGNPRIFHGKSSLTVDMGAYEYGSWPFKVLQLSQVQGGGALLTWKSRPGDDYIVWWCHDIGGGWTRDDATIPSGGEQTTWTDPNTTSTLKFYRIELE